MTLREAQETLRTSCYLNNIVDLCLQGGEGEFLEGGLQVQSRAI